MEAKVEETIGLSVRAGNSHDGIGACLESTTGGARGWVLFPLLLVDIDVTFVGVLLDVGNVST